MLFTSQTISVANLAVFPRIWACVFVELRVCLKTYGLLVIGLVLIEICLFFGLVFRRFLITDFWLFFKFTCLFLQNNLASLQTMLGKAKRLIESFWVKSSNWSKLTKHCTTVQSEAAVGKSVRSGKLCANVICPNVWRHTKKS